MRQERIARTEGTAMNFKVSIAQLVTSTIAPQVESEPKSITKTVGDDSWGKPLSDMAPLTEVLNLFRDTYTVDEVSDELAMHAAHDALDQMIRDAPTTNGQSYALSMHSRTAASR